MESGGQVLMLSEWELQYQTIAHFFFYKEHIYKQPVLIFFKSRNQVLNLSDHKELKSFF